jgi:hypothetical protein
MAMPSLTFVLTLRQESVLPPAVSPFGSSQEIKVNGKGSHHMH